MGQILAGRFELVDVLESGGAGTVWRAWDHETHAFVAAKVLRQIDDTATFRFLQESRSIIEDRHTVVPRNRVTIDDTLLFTMDLVDGGSVATLLADYARLPEGWVTELAGQATSALAAVHAAGIVHRDIKPANLLLETTGRSTPHLRLSDFGAAARLDGPRLTNTSAVIGTPGYLSPEAHHGAPPAPAQDIYALGITLRHMATGNQPDLEPQDHDEAPAPPPVSSPLAELIDAMTAEQPTDRPRAAADLFALLAELPAAGQLDHGADPLNPIVVYNQIPPLPAGWTPHGPVPRPTGSRTHPSTVSATPNNRRPPDSGRRPATASNDGENAVATGNDTRALVQRATAALNYYKTPAALAAAGIALVALALLLA